MEKKICLEVHSFTKHSKNLLEVMRADPVRNFLQIEHINKFIFFGVLQPLSKSNVLEELEFRKGFVQLL